MRRLGIALLGTLLCLPVGCGGKSEDKSPEKTGNAGADTKANADSTAGNSGGVDIKTTDPPPKGYKGTEVAANPKTTDAETKPAGNNTTTGGGNAILPNTTPGGGSPSEVVKLPAELTALSYVPGETIALFSARPSAVLNKPLLKSLGPFRAGIDQALRAAERESGINPGNLERVTLALWMGEGHAFPGRGMGRRSEKRALGVPEGKEPDFREERPGIEKFEEPEIKAPEFPKPPRGAAANEVPDESECGPQPGDEVEEDFPPPGGPGGPGGFGPRLDAVIIFQFNKPFDAKGLEAAARGDFKDEKHNDVTYRASFDTAYYQPNPKTLILCPRGDMLKALDAKAKAAGIVQSAVKRGLDHDATALVELASLRLLLQGPAMMVDGDLPGLADLPGQLESVYAHLDVEEGVKLTVNIDANSEGAPKTIKTAFDKGYGMAGQFIAFQLPDELNREFGEDLGPDLTKLAHTVYAGAKGEAKGKQFSLSLEVPGTVTDLLPKLVKRQQDVAKAMVGKNNMKQIGIAIHNYHDTFRQFPFPNGRSDLPKAEQNKLSWRVHLLPYIDEYPLYEQFKLDEAWDSDHNKKLLAKMPDVYKLSEGTKEGHTQFVLPAGKGYFGEETGRGLRFRDVTDGPSNSLMGVTVVPEKAVPWTKPGGFELDLKQAAKILGGHDQGFLALFADGRVQTLDPDIDAETLKALLTISGNEIVDYFDFETGRGRRR